MTKTDRAADVLEALKRERPMFHGRKQAGSQNYAIQWSVLEWMAEHVASGSSTLETGCGYSTVLLAAVSHAHTVISPFKEEHALIKAWCAQHAIDTQLCTFVSEASQEVLPSMEPLPLDLILIDGDHAFPAPFIDWYYTADRLKVGGYVVVDDIQIPTGAILKEFLLLEKSRWELVAQLDKTVVFKRLTSEPVAKGISWTEQPFCRH